MSAIVTLTFNPCLDVHVSVPSLVPERKLRCDEPVFQPGGGGINVARALRQLGFQSKAIYLASGNNGKELTRMLQEEGVETAPLFVEGNTRENLVVVDRSTGLQYRFILPGPPLTKPIHQELLQMIERENPEFLVVSGSLPPGLYPDIFDGLIALAESKGTKLIIDTSGEALKRAVRDGVYLIKPSIRELYSLFDSKEPETPEGAEALAKKLVDEGRCRVVVVSMGASGVLLVTAARSKWIPAPEVKSVSSVGAGDSMVAGIVVKLYEGKELEEAVTYGCACGAAAIMRPGTSLCHPEDVEKVYAQLSGTTLSPAKGNPVGKHGNYTLL